MSFLRWLDSSEHDRRKALDVIHLFQERNTRDELGVGAVRDAFSEILYPGTSTIQTRAKYFLFVPWICRMLEKKKVSSERIAREVWRQEMKLIDTLAASDDPDGTVGIEARRNLKRPASNIYWQGLGRLGIRLFQGSQDQYYRVLDAHYRLATTVRIADDGDAFAISKRTNWHSALPTMPSQFPEKAFFALSRDEAKYLRERVLSCAAGTHFAFLLDRGRATEYTEFPWMHPQIGELPSKISNELMHGQNFSEVMLGAALLYNLMLAEKSNNAGLVDDYRGMIEHWEAGITSSAHRLAAWDRYEFWEVTRRGRTNVTPRTKRFIDKWIDQTVQGEGPTNTADNAVLRKHIHERERVLKRGQARLENPRALERWTGAAGTTPLDYRWAQVQRIVTDIHSGLGR